MQAIIAYFNESRIPLGQKRTSTGGQGRGFGYSGTWGFILAIGQKIEEEQECGNPTPENYRAIFAGGKMWVRYSTPIQ